MWYNNNGNCQMTYKSVDMDRMIDLWKKRWSDMKNRTVREGDYILITDQRESNRYLKVGEVINIEYDYDGDIKECTVRFGYNYETSEEDLSWYRYDLPEMCRVLKFEDR